MSYHLKSYCLSSLAVFGRGLSAFGALCLLSSSVMAQDATPKEPKPTEGIKVNVFSGAKRELVQLAIPAAAGDNDKVKARVHELLKRDLELAGYFKVIDDKAVFFDASKEGMSADKINFDNWTNVGAAGLIKSEVKEQGGKLSLDLRLYLVNKKQQVTLKFAPKATSESGVDAQVHEFVNALLEYYTGKQGIFGSQIAYVGRNKSGLKQIYVTDMSGMGSRAITSNSSINLLPTYYGGRIFYTSYQDRNPDLWVYEGGKHRKLSSQQGQNSGASACGGKVALTLSMGGSNTDIYLIDPKTGQQSTRLTDHWAIDTSASFSPDCSKIAFVSGRAGSPQIYVMNADGSNQRRLTYQGTYNTSPSWSPSGEVIAFQGRDERNNYDIFTVNLAGSIERLTQDQGSNEDPSFSPDGRYVTFTSDRDKKRGHSVWIMTSDGQYQRKIVDGSYSNPFWSR